MRFGPVVGVCALLALAGCSGAGLQAPLANAGGPYSGAAGTAVSFSGASSSDPQGQVLTYAWNFGDNTTGAGVSPSHTYSGTGIYTVSLTVTDTSALSATASSKATILGPPVANAGGPYAGTTGTTVNFSGTTSTDPQGQTLTYAWSFGDGTTGTGASPNHTYATAGTYTVSLTVTDTSGLSGTATGKATIVAPPVANAGGPYAGIEGVSLAFNGSASTDPRGQALTYAWDFGDGNTGSGVAPTHTYAALGTYTVKVTVTDTSSLSNTAAVQVVVPNGRVYASPKALAGAHVYVFAANTTGYGGMGLAASSTNASVSLLSAGSTGQSDSVGAYVLTGADGSFFLAGDYSCTPGSQVYLYALGGSTGSGTNTGIGLLAALGVCPNSGNFASIPYIWVNEVSTVATAYAFAGFATDATHVSSSGTALAQVGIANAFANAAQMETLSTGVALTKSPYGNIIGGVPQSEINTLASILNGCSSSSTGCSTLLATATADGTSTGTKATDTATAAINIAHHPGSNITPLFGLASAGTFVPILTAQPNDFTVFIAHGVGGDGMAIDGMGNVWSFSQNSGKVYEASSLGVPISPTTGYAAGTGSGSYRTGKVIAVDPSGNVWVVADQNAGNSTGGIIELSSTGTLLSPASGFTGGGLSTEPSAIAIDGSGNAWIGNGGTVTGFNPSGGALTPSGGYPVADGTAGIAIDGTGKIWTTGSALNELNAAGQLLSPNGGYKGGGLSPYYSSWGLIVDGAGNLWMIESLCNCVGEFSHSGTALSPSSGFTGGGMISPQDLAVDGAGNVWVEGFSGVTEISSTGTVLSPASPYARGYGGSNVIAVDGSGNVWVSGGELVGIATPVVTPTSVGVKNNTLGTRP